MRQFIVYSVVALNLLSPTVLAGGVQGCMERVLGYRALEADSLKPKADRKIGWRCTDWEVTDAEKREGKCKGSWEQFSDVYSDTSFNNFMKFIGDQHVDASDWLKKKADGSIDIDKTASNCYNKHTAANAKVRNFEAHEVFKTDNDRFESYVEKLSDTVSKAPDEVPDADKDKAKDIRANYYELSQRVQDVRVGDHGKHLIKDATKKLKGQLDIETRTLGKDPLNTNVDLKTVDWAKTAQKGIASGKSKQEVRNLIDGFNKEYYKKRNPAEHRSVVRSYIKAGGKAKKCI
ncbi:hypothetical protein LMH87_000563 [Akanthomyces muscarius]|uniref:Uncharacterized protein n=1 Tax=Akanthomyces muscarius TaxID=2231603 RepID=A0A9W8QET6_AKAMU|nr:hypothetical protein LMH87_000563 [Akanthomyces muscarius]KAJ4155309.1 hypothetical protein LMH87_000563 [Akanthomyces muscarius]